MFARILRSDIQRTSGHSAKWKAEVRWCWTMIVRMMVLINPNRLPLGWRLPESSRLRQSAMSAAHRN